MERSVTIVDEFLPTEIHTALKNILMGDESDFAWYYNTFKVKNGLNSDHPLEDDRIDFQFTHMFYRNYSVTSNHFGLLIPIIDKLNACALVRIKANLSTYANAVYDYHYHTDQEGFVGKTAIYYVNSTNGPTKFEDGTVVDCIENRMVFFNSTLKHTGTTCTDNKVRCVINFNYFENQ